MTASLPTPDEMSVSVCICARNRPDELGRALTSISQSSIAPRQIVVSDDSDDDRVAELVAAQPLSITYDRGPRSGLGANRNHAISLATGERLLFLDDDACLGEDFLSTMACFLFTLPSDERTHTIVTGIEIKDDRPIVPRDQDFLGFQSRKYRPNEPLRTVVINATLFPRQLFHKVQFDPLLMYGYDEVDVTTQAVALGFAISPCFNAVNYHHPSPINRDEYSPFTQASRLYVTLKRRRFTQNSPGRAWLGFALGVSHVYLTAARRDGIRGIVQARLTTSRAYHFYRQLSKSMAQARPHRHKDKCHD